MEILVYSFLLGQGTCRCPLLDSVVKYIQSQEEHHRKHSFKEEYLALLNKFPLNFTSDIFSSGSKTSDRSDFAAASTWRSSGARILSGDLAINIGLLWSPWSLDILRRCRPETCTTTCDAEDGLSPSSSWIALS